MKNHYLLSITGTCVMLEVSEEIWKSIMNDIKKRQEVIEKVIVMDCCGGKIKQYLNRQKVIMAAIIEDKGEEIW